MTELYSQRDGSKGKIHGWLMAHYDRTLFPLDNALLDALMIEVPAIPEDAPDAERPQLCLDRGYDYDACRDSARTHGYVAPIPPKASAAQPLPPPGAPDRHPPRRWVVEVAHAWFNRFRRLLIRWEKKADNYLALVQLAAVLIIYRKLRHAHLLFG
jgi:putative transposase